MQTTGGATPLMYACQQSLQNEVLDLLRKQPHSVKDRDRTSKTPLHYCAENPNTSCAELILRAAPELVNAQDDNGYSTLHLAVIAGNKALIKLLITKGVDVNVHDNEGHSAVHWAIVSSEKEALEMIIRAGANPSTADVHGGYPLHYAVQMCGSSCDYIRSFEDAVRVVETLLYFGVDVNVKDKDSRQPILWAASAGSAEAVIHLVSAGACVEAADKDGLTALHCAASRGHTTTLETLISLCGANVDVIDGNGCSALFYAVTLGHADATELLLRLGAEANRQDRKGRTPAHCGAAKGQLETLRILQKHGGNLWLRNVKGDIPLHEAVASGRKDLVLWLLSQNPEAINIANNDGRCPLHIASMYNNTEMVKVLLDSKSLVNPVMRTSKGVLMTPLNVALSKGHRSCGKYLQLHGGVPFSKVAKLEPASVFAVRVSPSDEVTMKSIETSKEISHVSNSKISKCRSPADCKDQEPDKAETGEKKKVYRRRKKKKSTSSVPTQDSDSNDSIQDVKVKAFGSRKVKKSSEMEANTKDEHDEKLGVKKDKSDTKSFQVDKNSKNGSDANLKNNSRKKATDDSEDRVTKTKPLQSTKSFNETKNVSDLSPEDFPPLMQTITQLDTVMMEPDIEENKFELHDAERHVSFTRAAEVPEGNEGDQISADAVSSVENQENSKNEIEVIKDEIKKNVVLAQEESKKAVDIQKQKTETKPVESKSINENGSSLKLNKSPKSSSSGKKEERYTERNTGKTGSASSEGSDKHKKISRPKSPKVEMLDQAEEKSSHPNSIKSTDGGIDKFLNSEGKTNEEIKENENEEPKPEPETGGPNNGFTLKDETQSNRDDYSEEVKKPEGAAGTGIEGGKNDFSSFSEYEKKDNSAYLDELEPLVPLTPGETTKSALDNDTSGVIVTAKEDANPSPFEEREIEVNDAIQTSAGAPEQPGDREKAENVDEHSSEMFRTDVLPARNSSEKNSGNDSDSLVRKAAQETNEEEDLSNTAEKEFVDLQISNEEAKEELRDAVTEQSNETAGIEPAKDEIGKEEAVEMDEVQNEGNVFEDGESSKNNDCENKPSKVTRVSRLCRRHRDLKGDMNDMSVTQLVQNTIRKYHMERGIFYQLLELKRYQIRSGRANEQVLVKRLADEYERSRVFLGMKPYSGLYKFREFEKFLYDQLKALNARRSFLIPELKSYDDIDVLSGFLKKSRYKIINDSPQPEMVCTCITQRCHHSACAYTSVPCSAYITDLRRLRRSKPKREGLFPRIDQPPSLRSDAEKFAGRPATLELIQGSEKHVITLPQHCPGKGKRYYVTFTIKNAPAFQEDDLVKDSKSLTKHRHAKSV